MVDKKIPYLLAIVVGSFVTAVMVNFLKKDIKEEQIHEEAGFETALEEAN